MKLFLKSILVGFGGISPGLSGSVMMILFGLYQDALEAVGTIFTDFKKKIRFLAPMGVGMLVGVFAFSKLINYLLQYHSTPTRFAFLGLVLGTIPFFWREVKKKGFSWPYFLVIAAAFVAGLFLFTLNNSTFPQITDPSFAQKVLLGIAVAISTIIPGVDPMVFLSSLGLYELYISALDHIDFGILLPMALGVAAGGIAVSFLMTKLLRRFYTAAFSVIFGVFLSMIPNVLEGGCHLGWDWKTLGNMLLLLAGFALSFWMGRLECSKKSSTAYKEREKP